MGKNLIIKGADFSVNRLDKLYFQTSLYQGCFIANPNPTGSLIYGETYATDDFVRAIIPIIIPVGKRVQVYVSDGANIVQGLKVAAIWSTTIFDISSDGVAIPDIVGNIYPSSIEQRQSDGSFIITNNCSVAAYLYTTHSYYPDSAKLSAETHQYYYRVLLP